MGTNKQPFHTIPFIDNNKRAKECMDGVYIKTPDQKIYSGINSITFLVESLYRNLNSKENKIKELQIKINEQELMLRGFEGLIERSQNK